MKRVIGVLGVGLAMGLSACGGPSEIEKAVDACNDQLNVSMTAGDGGNSVSVSNTDFDLPVAGDRAGLATQASLCVLGELSAPDSLRAKINDTNSMMGRQSDTWDSYKVSWTYHPDNGLEIVVETT